MEGDEQGAAELAALADFLHKRYNVAHRDGYKQGIKDGRLLALRFESTRKKPNKSKAEWPHGAVFRFRLGCRCAACEQANRRNEAGKARYRQSKGLPPLEDFLIDEPEDPSEIVREGDAIH